MRCEVEEKSSWICAYCEMHIIIRTYETIERTVHIIT